MKRLFKMLVLSRPGKTFIKVVAVLLGYKPEIFKSKWFETDTGYIWVLKSLWFQRIIGLNRFKRNIVHHTTNIGPEKNLRIHRDSINNLMSPGCYFQCFSAKIFIEKDVYIAPNVGLITANHDPQKLDTHLEGKDIILSERCWIGMNSIILPGVVLGKGTIVAAGSVVTKSYPEGNVLLAGTPAVIKKVLD